MDYSLFVGVHERWACSEDRPQDYSPMMRATKKTSDSESASGFSSGQTATPSMEVASARATAVHNVPSMTSDDVTSDMPEHVPAVCHSDDREEAPRSEGLDARVIDKHSDSDSDMNCKVKVTAEVIVKRESELWQQCTLELGRVHTVSQPSRNHDDKVSAHACIHTRTHTRIRAACSARVGLEKPLRAKGLTGSPHTWTHRHTYAHTHTQIHMHTHTHVWTDLLAASQVPSKSRLPKSKSFSALHKNGSLETCAPEKSHISRFQQYDGGFASLETVNGIPVAGRSPCL
jgi:hypothetical protein